MADNIKIVFAPGSLDEFDGTQEDLDKMVQQIKDFVESGEIPLNATILSGDDLSEDFLHEIFFENTDKRTLH